ncbi:DotA/TraY family protein [Moraxella sp. ZJ142]|uniref:DotA/TraY family protein n=1 Tax=Moraxella marmotae TaxID=3344520 RepID=UPI0035D514E7
MADNTSFMCPHGAAACEQDKVIQILQYLFDENFIRSFYTAGQSPALTQIDPNGSIVPLLINQVSVISLTVVLLILAFSMIANMITSTNDGEIKGFARGSGSILGLWGRPLFSVLMLFPTVSGYPLVAVFLMAITLNSNGIANKAYEKFAEKAVLVSPAINNIDQNPAFAAANNLTDAAFYGAIQGYCAKSAMLIVNQPFLNEVSFKSFNANQKAGFEIYDKASNQKSSPTCGGLTLEIPDWSVVDAINSAGVVVDTPVGMTPIVEPWNNSSKEYFIRKVFGGQSASDMERIGATIKSARNLAALATYRDAFYLAAGTEVASRIKDLPFAELTNTFASGAGSLGKNWVAQLSAPPPVSHGWQVQIGSSPDISNTEGGENGAGTGSAGGNGAQGASGEAASLAGSADAISVEKIIAIANNNTAQLNAEIKNYLTEKKVINNKVSAKNLREMEEQFLKNGWLDAGFSRARLNSVRKVADKTIYARGDSFHLNPQDPDPESESMFNKHLDGFKGVYQGLLREFATIPGVGTGAGNISTLSMASQASANGDKIDENRLVPTGLLSRMIYGTEEYAIQGILGVKADDGQGLNLNHEESGDILFRIQDSGEMFLITATMISVIEKAAVIGLSVVGAALKGAGTNAGVALLTLGSSIGASDVLVQAIFTLFTTVIEPFLEEAREAFELIGLMLGVVIPTMPYFLLTLAAIGWILQVTQTMFAIPVFLIMHALQGDRFIGSQQQGYITLIGLFFRPILILCGFYLAFVLYEPAVILFTQTFFNIKQTLAGSTSSTTIGELLSILTTMKAYWYIYSFTLVAITYLIFGLVQELGDNILDWLGTNLLRNFGNLDSDRIMRGMAGTIGGLALAAKSRRKEAMRNNKERSREMEKARDNNGGGEDPQDDQNKGADTGKGSALGLSGGKDGNKSALDTEKTPESTVAADEKRDETDPKGSDDKSPLGEDNPVNDGGDVAPLDGNPPTTADNQDEKPPVNDLEGTDEAHQDLDEPANDQQDSATGTDLSPGQDNDLTDTSGDSHAATDSDANSAVTGLGSGQGTGDAGGSDLVGETPNANISESAHNTGGIAGATAGFLVGSSLRNAAGQGGGFRNAKFAPVAKAGQNQDPKAKGTDIKAKNAAATGTTTKAANNTTKLGGASGADKAQANKLKPDGKGSVTAAGGNKGINKGFTGSDNISGKDNKANAAWAGTWTSGNTTSANGGASNVTGTGAPIDNTPTGADAAGSGTVATTADQSVVNAADTTNSGTNVAGFGVSDNQNNAIDASVALNGGDNAPQATNGEAPASVAQQNGATPATTAETAANGNSATVQQDPVSAFNTADVRNTDGSNQGSVTLGGANQPAPKADGFTVTGATGDTKQQATPVSNAISGANDVKLTPNSLEKAQRAADVKPSGSANINPGVTVGHVPNTNLGAVPNANLGTNSASNLATGTNTLSQTAGANNLNPSSLTANNGAQNVITSPAGQVNNNAVSNLAGNHGAGNAHVASEMHNNGAGNQPQATNVNLGSITAPNTNPAFTVGGAANVASNVAGPTNNHNGQDTAAVSAVTAQGAFAGGNNNQANGWPSAGVVSDTQTPNFVNSGNTVIGTPGSNGFTSTANFAGGNDVPVANAQTQASNLAGPAPANTNPVADAGGAFVQTVGTNQQHQSPIATPTATIDMGGPANTVSTVSTNPTGVVAPTGVTANLNNGNNAPVVNPVNVAATPTATTQVTPSPQVQSASRIARAEQPAPRVISRDPSGGMAIGTAPQVKATSENQVRYQTSQGVSSLGRFNQDAGYTPSGQGNKPQPTTTVEQPTTTPDGTSYQQGGRSYNDTSYTTLNTGKNPEVVISGSYQDNSTAIDDSRLEKTVEEEHERSATTTKVEPKTSDSTFDPKPKDD